MAANVIHISAEDGLRPSEAQQVKKSIESGKLLIFPTDTVYGLGCDAFQEAAVERIDRLKGRRPERPFSVHLGSVTEIERYAWRTERQRSLVGQLLPGPYTVILEAMAHAPPSCVSREGKIGVRVPKSRSFRFVYGATGRPLVGTSVNRSGEPPLTQTDEIIERFADHVDLIVVSDEPLTRESSTVIDFTADPPDVLRGRLPEALAGRLRRGEPRDGR